MEWSGVEWSGVEWSGVEWIAECLISKLVLVCHCEMIIYSITIFVLVVSVTCWYMRGLLVAWGA